MEQFDAPSESRRGIPQMEVVEDIDEYLKKEGCEPGDGLQKMSEAYKKYKYVEANLAAQKTRMMEKIPEYDNSLTIVEILLERRDKGESFETHHMISEDVYTKAVVEKPEKVSIWLGANIMVEYNLDEAKELLQNNKATVQAAIDELSRELLFVKDQITTTEVNLAHMHNYNVLHRIPTQPTEAPALQS